MDDDDDDYISPQTYSSDSDTDKPFYESSSDGGPRKHSSTSPSLDADHRLLLRAAKPLLQSRNSGVVLAVAQLFYHCGPGNVILVSSAFVLSYFFWVCGLPSKTLNKPKLFQSKIITFRFI